MSLFVGIFVKDKTSSCRSVRETIKEGIILFEVGKTYKLDMIEPDGSRGESFNCEILYYDKDKGLIKVKQFDKIKIINITSSHFIKAEEQ